MKIRYFRLAFFLVCGVLLSLLAACGPTVDNQSSVNSTNSVSKTFQAAISPIPSVPTYRCGSWAAPNNPSSNATVTIYARLMNNKLAPVSGASANAVVHFQSGDASLGQAQSDSGGYVSFTLPLQGQQPSKIPATVSVTFTSIPGSKETVNCSQAFFTPQ